MKLNADSIVCTTCYVPMHELFSKESESKLFYKKDAGLVVSDGTQVACM